jgi:hypothetical protein
MVPKTAANNASRPEAGSSGLAVIGTISTAWGVEFGEVYFPSVEVSYWNFWYATAIN